MASSAGAPGSEDDEIAAINITPLVDVVLVLLIIFMITAPQLYQNALKVNLPDAKTGEDTSKGTMQIVLDETGVISVEKKSYTIETLGQLVAASHPASSIIMADKKVQHGKVIEIIDLLKSHGVQKFSFGVEKP